MTNCVSTEQDAICEQGSAIENAANDAAIKQETEFYLNQIYSFLGKQRTPDDAGVLSDQLGFF